jgi:peroxiredoxin
MDNGTPAPKFPDSVGPTVQLAAIRYNSTVMPTLTSRVYTIFSLVLLFSGAAWIWLSRAPAGATTQGAIPAPQKGFLAPDFKLETGEGESVQLSELRGKPVVVNFWTSWCPPCREEMPALQRVHQDYQEKGVVILGLNSTVQDDRQQAQAFAAKQGLTFPIVFDEQGEATRLYQVRALPTTFFVDAQGMIQELITGGPMSEALLRIRVEQLLNSSNTGGP